VPTYQYTCTECGEPLEAVQRFTDAPLTECPACGGRLRKVFSAVGIVFKGSGFYRTDSRNGAKATAPAGSSSTSDSGSSNGSADKAADKKADKADKKAEPAKPSSASEKVA
jgi:putative FmdB family regulatory protein